MQALEDIFRLWDSTSDLAREIDELPDTVQRWRKKKRIPEHAWSKVIKAGQAKTDTILSLELLLQLNTPARHRGRPRKVAA